MTADTFAALAIVAITLITYGLWAWYEHEGNPRVRQHRRINAAMRVRQRRRVNAALRRIANQK